MKIAIVHDYLIADGGAEKVLKTFLEIFPKAPLYTLFYDKEKFRELWGKDIRVSFLDKIPFLKREHAIFLPLYPKAIESLDLKDYDVILSSSWAWSKGIKKNRKTCHICYCHTPMRFAHGMERAHLRTMPVVVQTVARKIVRKMKKWDLDSARRVDYFIANSVNVRDKIRDLYNKNSTVIYPPVDMDTFKLNSQKKGDYFLISSRLVPYKHIDIAIKAFNELGLSLKVCGDGVEFKRLKMMAGPNVELLGFVSKDKLLELYQNCRAFIMPQEEDFGIAAVEALACGSPVIAYAKGGALEYVFEGKTGHFFYEQTPQALVKAIKEFQNMRFNPIEVRQIAPLFNKGVFSETIKNFVEKKYKEYQRKQI